MPLTNVYGICGSCGSGSSGGGVSLSGDSGQALVLGTDGGVLITGEQIQDIIGQAIAAGAGLTYNDLLNSISAGIVGASIVLPVRVTTVNTAVDPAADAVILVNSTVPRVVTLNIPASSQRNTFTVKNINIGAVTVLSATGLIDQSASFLLPARYAAIDFTWDGTNWWTSDLQPVGQTTGTVTAGDDPRLLAIGISTVNAVVGGRRGGLSVETPGIDGIPRWYNRTGKTINVSAIYAAVDTPSTGSGVTVTVWRNGVATGAVAINIIAGANSGVSSALTLTVADGEFLQAWPTSVGSSTPGSDLSVIAVGVTS